MYGGADLLAETQIVRTQALVRESDRSTGLRRTKVDDRTEVEVEPIELSREQRRDVERLPLGQSVELGDHRPHLEGEVERREALGWIPPSSEEPRPGAAQRIDAGADVAIRVRREADRAEPVELSDELAGAHLDEDAFGQRVDERKHTPELAGVKEIDRLVVVEERVGRKEPIVRCVGRERGR